MGATDSEPRPGWRDGGRSRVVLAMVGDKWSLLVVCNLSQGPRRFTELKRGIDGISQRMLTVTLRGLERDGMVTRTIHNVMPPHVSYELTPLGRTLREATVPLLEWTIEHLADVDDARARYDTRADTPPVPVQDRSGIGDAEVRPATG